MFWFAKVVCLIGEQESKEKRPFSGCFSLVEGQGCLARLLFLPTRVLLHCSKTVLGLLIWSVPQLLPKSPR